METKILNYTFKCNSDIDLTCASQSDDYIKIKIDINFGKKVKPEPIEISWFTPANGAFTCWSPLVFQDRKLRPNWGKLETESRSGHGMPIQCYIGSDDNNRASVYLSDVRTPITIRSGILEENGKIEWKLVLFSQLIGEISEYSTELVIDARQLPYNNIISEAVKCWSDKEGASDDKPEAAFDLLYSTWYSYHQRVTDAALIPELEAAAKLGMKTVIIDDGWQLETSARGYAYCGDWKAAKNKIPDLKSFSDKVHSLGMKVMLWFAVPFVGEFAEVRERFKDMYLNDLREGQMAYVLDPRYPETRKYLCDIYENAVREWDLDGLKLDFIDRFRLTDVSKTSHPDMDTESLQDAICTLLCEVNERLNAIKPGFLIEFRQGYVGPIMQKYGNMLRAEDCPQDSVKNRVAVINLRLTTEKAAVHSDMLMWEQYDTPEDAAEQIINVMFSVPQISVKINELSKNHYDMLEFYLKLWQSKRDTLIHGELYAKAPSANYSIVTAKDDDNLVSVLYSEKLFIADKDYECITLINGTGVLGLYVDGNNLNSSYSYDIYDCMGNVVQSGETGLVSIRYFDVPKSGVLIMNAKK